MQKQDFERLFAGRDARQEFAAFVNSEGIVHPDEHDFAGLSEQLGQLRRAHAFRLRMTYGMELDQAGGDGPDDGDWSDELNERRIDLIDKDIQETITSAERVELAELQRKAVA
jgi:hypothetical protein